MNDAAEQIMLAKVRQLITLRQAERIGPYRARDIRRKIESGALLAGVHYTLPHGSRDPLIVREAYLAWLLGDDGELRRPLTRRRPGRASFAAVGGL